MAMSKVDRSLLRTYPELRTLIEEKKLDETSSEQIAPIGMQGWNALDDPETIPQITAMDG